MNRDGEEQSLDSVKIRGGDDSIMEEDNDEGPDGCSPSNIKLNEK